jgi:hypothetical protein
MAVRNAGLSLCENAVGIANKRKNNEENVNLIIQTIYRF